MAEADSELLTTLLVDSRGERLDRYVADHIGQLSRTAVQRLIADGSVTVNDHTVSASYRVRVGDIILVRILPARPIDLQPEDLPLDVIHEDSDLVVLNKAAGMVVHPGPGHDHGTLVNAILAYCPDLQGIQGEIRPGIVHRLDRDTSGVIVVAKNDRALRSLQKQFRKRTVEKYYDALVVGWLDQDDGFIEAPLSRDPTNRKRMAVRAGGRAARTRWHVVDRYRDTQGIRLTLLDVQLLTGRTHQIRVHFSWLGYPLAGDATYGSRAAVRAAPRQFLHARSLAISHPRTADRMTFEATMPADLTSCLDSLLAEIDNDGE